MDKMIRVVLRVTPLALAMYAGSKNGWIMYHLGKAAEIFLGGYHAWH